MSDTTQELVNDARAWIATQDKESKGRHLAEILTDALERATARAEAGLSAAEVVAGAEAIFDRDCPGLKLANMTHTVRDNYEGDSRAALEAAWAVRHG